MNYSTSETVDDFGTITATGGPAIYANSVTLESGSVTNGQILGRTGNGILGQNPTSTFDDNVTIVAGADISNATFKGGTGTNDVINLAGTSSATIDLGTVSSFEIINKTDSGIWTLTNAGASATEALNVNGGTLILTGANAYTGSMTVSGGALQVGNGGTSGAITGNVVDNGTLAFDRSDAVTFTGSVSGTGSLTQAGAGALTLTGANTYTGGTTVTAGTLRLGNGGSLATTGALVVNGGTFDLNGHYQTVGALSVTGGTILLDNGGLTTNSSSSTTLASVISGSGNLFKSGTGTSPSPAPTRLRATPSSLPARSR